MVKEKSFNIQSKELGLNSVDNSAFKLKEYLLGKRIKILNTCGGHNYGSTGEVITLNNEKLTVSGGSGNTYNVLNNGIDGGNSLNFTRFSVLSNLTTKDIQDNIKSLKKNISDIKEEIKKEEVKIEYLKETGSEKYDENEFKVYTTLSLLEDPKLSKLEKARLVANLIKS